MNFPIYLDSTSLTDRVCSAISVFDLGGLLCICLALYNVHEMFNR